MAPTKAPLHTSGSNHPGLTITPDYSFADAPMPDIVVIGAQMGGPGLTEWLKKVHAQHHVIMSVCTGAFKLAQTGLLNGKQATTHHWYFGNFAREFPQVKLIKQVRYVQADPITFSAGGLTSGVDLSLHIVAEYFGEKVAQSTADYMEYQSTGWKSNQGISVSTTPVTHENWWGNIAPGNRVVLRMTTVGASPSFTTDIPAENVVAAPTSVKQNGDNVTASIDVVGHPATITGKIDNDAKVMNGTFTQDGKSYPLILKPQSGTH